MELGGNKIRVLELFSGIGGMRTSLAVHGLNYEIISSYEINPSALNIYDHNFSFDGKKRKAQNIMGLTAEKLTHLAPDLIMMSPPCQPFTRQGLKRDVLDNRCSPLIHFMSLIETTSTLPKMILLENVSGFETSEACQKFTEVLRRRKYMYQEFLLSPVQFGIPNSRLRYYLLAKQEPESFVFCLQKEIHAELPLCNCYCPNKNLNNAEQNEQFNNFSKCANCSKLISKSLNKIIANYMDRMEYKIDNSLPKISRTLPNIDNSLPNIDNSLPSKVTPLLDICEEQHNGLYLYEDKNIKVPLSELTPCLSFYLDNSETFDRFLVPPKILRKYSKVLDIVTSESKQSCCFTKGYSNFALGTGSVLHGNVNVSLAETYANAEIAGLESDEGLELMQKLGLRYFTPREILKLMGFPPWFKILEEKVSLRESYKALGNSVNVFVITILLDILITSGYREKL